ncbi:MAG: ATP-binding protein [Deltaproteobacteria bacterium]|nr:ATP-binding protein [Deltaproteobacteria bacterium]
MFPAVVGSAGATGFLVEDGSDAGRVEPGPDGSGSAMVAACTGFREPQDRESARHGRALLANWSSADQYVAMGKLLPRHMLRLVREALDAFPAVVLTGARQVGKSTLAQQLVRERGGSYLTLDDIAVRSQALADPQGLVDGQRGFVALDEVQLAPDLLRAIKLAVDRDRAPGRFLLTGSANLLGMRTVGETLAGRAAWLELPPLVWSEIAGRPCPQVIDRAFAARDAGAFLAGLAAGKPHLVAQAQQRAVAGGMPATLGLTAAQRRTWYDGYRRTFLERDLRQLGQIENLPEFVRLLSLAALRSAGLLNKSALAAEAGLTHPTLRRYFNLLEVAQQFYELPPFHANLGKRLVKTAKLYASDPGLAAYLTGVESWADAVSSGREGALFETWVVGELRALDRCSSRPSSLCFWRTSVGREVDLILERGRDVVAVEIKASGTVTAADTAALRELRDGLGDRFRLGIVACLARNPTLLDRKLCVAPLPSLLGID